MTAHPMWQMYRGRREKPAPLYISNDYLCSGLGGKGPTTWELCVLDGGKLGGRMAEERVRGGKGGSREESGGGASPKGKGIFKRAVLQKAKTLSPQDGFNYSTSPERGTGGGGGERPTTPRMASHHPSLSVGNSPQVIFYFLFFIFIFIDLFI